MARISKMQREVLLLLADKKPLEEEGLPPVVLQGRYGALGALRNKGFVYRKKRELTYEGWSKYEDLIRAKTGKPKREVIKEGDPRTEPDWAGSCEVCEASPIVPLTGMCGPCTFGEADTAGGNW